MYFSIEVGSGKHHKLKHHLQAGGKGNLNEIPFPFTADFQLFCLSGPGIWGLGADSEGSVEVLSERIKELVMSSFPLSCCAFSKVPFQGPQQGLTACHLLQCKFIELDTFMIFVTFRILQKIEVNPISPRKK